MSDSATGSPVGGGSTAASTPNTPIGTVPASTPAPTNNAPAVIDLSDDSMVRVPGQKDPVKYGDYYRSFQAQFTRKAQEAKQAAERQAQLERAIQERDQQLAAYQRQFQGQPQNPAADLRKSLAALPYLDGNAAGSLVDHITNQFSAFEQALAQRDQALILLTRKLQSLDGTVGGLRDRSAGSEFNTKISGFVKDLGLDPSLQDWAKEVYLAYEGDDLDQEFPGILKARYEQLVNSIREGDRRRVEEAKNRPFVPSKGGFGAAAKPIANLAKASAAEIADQLWPGVDGSET